MNTIQRIAKNTSVLVIAQILNYALGFLFIAFTARYLGAENFGILSFALAFAGIFGVLNDLGLSTLMTREVSKKKSYTKKYLGNIITIKMVLSIIVSALIIITINIPNYPYQTVFTVYLAMLFVIANSFNQIFNSVFQSYEKMEYQSLGIIINSLMLFSGALLLIHYELNVTYFALLYFISISVVLIYNLIVCTLKFIRPKIEFDLNFWKPFIKESLPLGLSTLCVVAYFRIDTILLSLLTPNGNEAIGLYNAAYRISEAFLFIPTAFMGAIFPLLSKYYKPYSMESFEKLYSKGFKLLLIIGLFIAINLSFFSSYIIPLVYGPQFNGSVFALQIISWSLLFMFIGGLLSFSLISIGIQRIILKYTIIGLIFNIILNIILIPSFSYIGAAIGTVMTELVVSFIAAYYVYKETKIIISSHIIVKLIIIGTIMYIILNYIGIKNICILVTISVFTYIFLIIVFKLFDNEDLNLLKKIFEMN
ncbi:MAG: flippase [Methanobacteriaceae archaeon]|nr:flippase [Methanobacteriaceae archaeon]